MAGVDESNARQLVERFLGLMDGDRFVITAVEEYAWGWAFFWTSKDAADNPDRLEFRLAGAGPYLVDRHSGAATLCGSALEVSTYVDLWQRGEMPSLRSPAELDPFPEPWFDLRSWNLGEFTPSQMATTAELKREMPPGHALYDVAAEPLAKCSHCDSVAFAIAADRYAIVHLTWSRSLEQPPWPFTEILSDRASMITSMTAYGS